MHIFYSGWDGVHPRTQSVSGHARQDTHFYVVLKWGLPEEMADQLVQLARINPDNESW